MRRGETYRALVRGQYTSYIAVTDITAGETGTLYTAIEVLFRDIRTPTISTVVLTEMEMASYHYTPVKVFDTALAEAYDALRTIVKKAATGAGS